METTIIIVSYKQTELIKAAHSSIRRFYPTIPVIIIDGSPADSDCWNYLHSLNDPNTRVHTLEYNIGHGRGLHMGIGMATTEYVLLMDSDVEIRQIDAIECMLDRFYSDTYGVGKVVYVNEHGGDDPKGLPYLHPHFALIKKSKYEYWPPLINHGAPFIKTMIALERHVYSDKVVNFESISNFIMHKERGTRAINPPEFHPSNWDKV